MSIMGAMNSALTGLAAASRGAATVSNNLSNAMTDGFARRELELSARTATGGVLVTGEVRHSDRILLTDRRNADADIAMGQAQIDFLSSVQSVIGEPGSPQSLSDMVTQVETALVASAAQPQSGPLLEAAVDRLVQLTGRVSDIAGTVQTERGRADAAINQTVSQLNADLARLESLNEDIRNAHLHGRTGGGLLDQRERVIDRISAAVPVREVDRGNGTVALLSQGGILMDGPAPSIGFSPSPTVTEFQSLDAGTLSGLTLNGETVDLGRARNLLSGGRLQGLLEVRDTLGPMMQERLDGFARDLLERFTQPGVDPTLTPGDPGLITDDGASFAPPNEVGLSRRLRLNALADPDAGGAAWRLRDGLGAATPGDVGVAAGLQRLEQALASPQAPVSGGFAPGIQTAAGLAAQVLGSAGTARDVLEGNTSHATARSEALGARLAENGVDSDAEMQRLLLIEQAYAANAKVIAASQSMLDTLMEI